MFPKHFPVGKVINIFLCGNIVYKYLNISDSDFNQLYNMVRVIPLDPEVRAALENNGGTKEATKALKESIGKNFAAFVESSEADYFQAPLKAPQWWWKPVHSGVSLPRKINDFGLAEESGILGEYWRE